MLNMKIDQIAFIAHSDKDEADIKAKLGLTDAVWVEDTVVATGEVFGVPGTNTAKLLFNYDNGIEVEILRYTDGPNYAEKIPGGHLCHIGMHYSGEGDVPAFGEKIAQQVVTVSHTNEYVVSRGRHYRYTIFDTVAAHGVYLKVIERIQGEA
jgi:hypothetical protein